MSISVNALSINDVAITIAAALAIYTTTSFINTSLALEQNALASASGRGISMLDGAAERGSYNPNVSKVYQEPRENTLDTQTRLVIDLRSERFQAALCFRARQAP